MVHGEINKLVLLLLSSLVFSGFGIDAVPYDYHVTIECLASPHKPQYGGGLVVNPELNLGLKGWSAFGEAKIEQRVSRGNSFIVALYRHQPHDSFTQKFYLEKQKFYTFSAWLQVSQGNAEVMATFKTSTGFKHAGWVIAESGCWSMLKGGLVVNASGFADLYLESKNSTVEIWADSISLQPFTKNQWKSHQDQSIEKARKSTVKLRAVDATGSPLANASVSITESNLKFPFGCAMSKHILTNTHYQNWFTSRFKVTTFEDEMKWYSTEWSQGKEDYSVPDSMLQFAQNNGISVRGHNIFWNDPHYQPEWLKSLSSDQLLSAAERRLNSVVKRYAGQVIAWDVVNENLHFSFFENKFGKNASAVYYHKTHQLDSATTLFLNEFNTIEEMQDGSSTPAEYLKKIREIRSTGFNGPLGIGLEAHFSTPNLPYMRASIDKLAAEGLPIWLTELDVSSGPKQALYLEQVLREAHAHPAIKGIVMWASWKPEGYYRMCLTDNNFKNLPTGDVVDKLIQEWSHRAGSIGSTDTAGYFETKLFHGDYKVIINHSAMKDSPFAQNLKVSSTHDESQQETVLHGKISP